MTRSLGVNRAKAISLLLILCFSTALSLMRVQAAYADSEQRQQRAGTLIQRIIKGLADADIGIPPTLRTDKDAYVIVSAGAAYTQVMAVSRDSVPPERLAGIMESITSTTVEPREIRSSGSVNGYSYARIRFGHGAKALSAANKVSLGAVSDVFQSAGFTPHVLLRVPYHVTLTPAVSWRSARTSNFRWYNATSVAPGATVTLQAAFTSMEKVLLILIFLLSTCGISISITMDLLLRRKRVLSPRVRSGLLIGPSLVCGGLATAIIVIAFQSSHFRGVYADLFLSTATWQIPFACTLIYAAATTFIGVIMAIGILKRRRQSGKESEPTPEERKAVNKLEFLKLLGMIVIIVVFFGSLFLLPKSASAAKYFPHVIITLITLWFEISKGITRKRLARYITDPELTRRASAAASKAYLQLREIRIDEGLHGRQYASVSTHSPASLTISRKAVDVLTPEELEFVIVKELAEKPLTSRSVFVVAFLATAATIPVALWFFSVLESGKGLQGFFWMLSWILFAPSIFIWVSLRHKRLSSSRANQTALDAVQDPHVAASAIMKMARYSENIQEWKRKAAVGDKRLATLVQSLERAETALNQTADKGKPADT